MSMHNLLNSVGPVAVLHLVLMSCQVETIIWFKESMHW